MFRLWCIFLAISVVKFSEISVKNLVHVSCTAFMSNCHCLDESQRKNFFNGPEKTTNKSGSSWFSVCFFFSCFVYVFIIHTITLYSMAFEFMKRINTFVVCKSCAHAQGTHSHSIFFKWENNRKSTTNYLLLDGLFEHFIRLFLARMLPFNGNEIELHRFKAFYEFFFSRLHMCE